LNVRGQKNPLVRLNVKLTLSHPIPTGKVNCKVISLENYSNAYCPKTISIRFVLEFSEFCMFMIDLNNRPRVRCLVGLSMAADWLCCLVVLTSSNCLSHRLGH
jgi:hypothetical protein